MWIVTAGVFFFGVLAMRSVHAFAIPKWQASVALAVLGVALHIANVVLIRRYIRVRAPEFANDETWEHTAGLGIVPKWVSILGLLGIAAVIAALLPWFIAGIRLLF